MCDHLKESYDENRNNLSDKEEGPKNQVMDNKYDNPGNVDWKINIERNFKTWLKEVSEYPDPEGGDNEAPDLYSFYEELCVLRSEFRKNARRSHDTFARFGETLSEFENMTKNLATRVLEAEDDNKEAGLLLKIKFYIPFVDMFDRFKRIDDKLKLPPRTGFFSRNRTWENAWMSLREGFKILRSHFEELLKKEGVTAVETVGKPFDPSLMKAIEVEETVEIAPDTVTEEFSGGYLYHGHILKLAEVKVTGGKGE